MYQDITDQELKILAQIKKKRKLFESELITNSNSSDLSRLNKWGFISISCWVYLDSDNGDNNTIVLKTEDNTDKANFELRMEMANDRISFVWRNSADNAFRTIDSDNSSVSSGALYHIVITHTWGTTDDDQFYLNGSAINTSNGSTDAAYTTGTHLTYLGYRVEDATNPFDGKINELVLWDAILTSTEISLLYNSKVKRMPLQIQSSNLQLYLPLDDVSDSISADGATFLDMSGNTYNCTGDDGGGDSGLTGEAESQLTYP